MKIDYESLLGILTIGSICGVIATCITQKIKTSGLTYSRGITILISILTSFLVSLGFCYLFTNVNWKMSIAVGVISWVGASTIYSALEKAGLMTKLSQVNLEIDDGTKETEVE